ncbi:hypothetical protein KKG81_07385 [bacterium]|nr:hypothetical protein [bacterium]
MKKEDWLRSNETYYQTYQRFSKIPVHKRTDEHHNYLIRWKYDGSVRRYLLSIIKPNPKEKR